MFVSAEFVVSEPLLLDFVVFVDSLIEAEQGY